MFNGRDYSGVLAHFNEDAAICFADVRLTGTDEIGRFYSFFHEYVSEEIHVERYLSDENSVMLEAMVRLEGKKDLGPEILKNSEYPSLHPISKGQIIEMPQFIHYRLSGGKFSLVTCLVNPAAF